MPTRSFFPPSMVPLDWNLTPSISSAFLRQSTTTAASLYSATFSAMFLPLKKLIISSGDIPPLLSASMSPTSLSACCCVSENLSANFLARSSLGTEFSVLPNDMLQKASSSLAASIASSHGFSISPADLKRFSTGARHRKTKSLMLAGASSRRRAVGGTLAVFIEYCILSNSLLPSPNTEHEALSVLLVEVSSKGHGRYPDMLSYSMTPMENTSMAGVASLFLSSSGAL
mmetsp:Transcript_6925/g.13349  ORF Transcript_6925/g.13349 Transcript_6925/m.13349 type:complete len:229 (-) Transcript_6925:1432-2118(-)